MTLELEEDFRKWENCNQCTLNYGNECNDKINNINQKMNYGETDNLGESDLTVRKVSVLQRRRRTIQNIVKGFIEFTPITN